METIDFILPEQMDTKPSVMEEINRIEGEINECKALLFNTDWCVTKCKETRQEMEDIYPNEGVLRENARLKINELELLVSELKIELGKEDKELNQ